MDQKSAESAPLSEAARHTDPSQLEAILHATHTDVFSFLGMHTTGDGAGMTVRVFRPDARELSIVALEGGQEYPAERIHNDGFFAAFIKGVTEPFGYSVRTIDFHGQEQTERDPYSFGRMLGEQDVYFYREGSHLELYRKFGAQLTEIGGVKGVAFTVWAPNARRASVVSDFNRWDGRVNPMRLLHDAGIWELFVPGVGEGAHYKFELVGQDGALILKTDPFAFYCQHGMQTASIVFDLDRYQWSDDDWIKRRAESDVYREPLSIYEVHLGSWARVTEEGNRFLSYRELADRLLDYVVEMGFTHIELLPISEFPFDGSWGYQVGSFYAPTSRFGNPDEFRYFIDRCHQRGVGVIIDWVPAHFPKDAHGLARFDGSCLYEHADPRQGEHQDWGTLIFNYGRHEVRNFLVSNALYWLDEFHIDGLRVDAVASMLYLDYSRNEGEWVPNQYGGRENLEAISLLRTVNEKCYEKFPGVMTIAEESTAFPGVSRPTFEGGLGFGFKWNMGWMHDFLQYMSKDPVYRRHHHHDATFSLIYAFHESFILVLSHDEVVHGKRSLIDKMPGDLWQKFANLRMFYGWMFAHPGKKLLFQGGEIAQWREWDHNNSIDWHLLEIDEHKGMQRLVQDLNRIYREEPALHELDHTYDGFEWIDFADAEGSIFSFMRKGRDGKEIVIMAVNATPVVREDYRLAVPKAGFYREIVNTDSEIYGGGNLGNCGGVASEDIPSHGRPQSICVTLPPLATVGFKFTPEQQID